MTKVLVVMGTRPEAIKLGPVVQRLREEPAFQAVVCATAQHREMLDQVLALFDIRPDVDLDIMREGQDLSFVTTQVLERMSSVLRTERPRMVVVQGDTTTTMATSLAAFYQRIPVAHVEAGLRTDDRFSPYPEEMNRLLVSRLADVHFAATASAARTLLAERTQPGSVFLTGNPVVDALQWVRQRAAVRTVTLEPGQRLVLVTAHRRENFGQPLADICAAIRRIADRHPDVEVVYPVHPNPNVTRTVHEILAGHPRIRLVPPVAYDEFVALMDRSTLVLSDSGGVQEEAPILGKPVLVLRENTERAEAVEAGAARIVGTDTERIVREAEKLLTDPEAYDQMARVRTLFGDGRAGSRIVSVLLQLVAGTGWGADEHRFRE